jgi:GT2 family glycosyltransferase
VPERRAITVVVPVYGDERSLIACVRSLIATVDNARDSVLLVNDCGPDANAIEGALVDVVAGRMGFRYERNAHNLGFVGTCNRAALELDRSGNDIVLLNSDTVTTPGWLDELSGVLHDDARHGMVSARSTNATIASLPHRLNDPTAARTLERSAQVAEALRDRLPRYSYPPVAMGFCFLVRRELIDRFGLFDEVFAPGYGEENDFCLRMGAEGYLSVIAHRVLIMHEGARSFQDSRRARLRADHERILIARHPEYTDRVREYLWCTIDPVDSFADVLAPPPQQFDAAYSPTTVIVVVPDAPTASLVTSIGALPNDLRLTVVTSARSVAAWRSAINGTEVLVMGHEEGRVWHLALCDSPASSEAALRAAHAAPRIGPLSLLTVRDALGDLITVARAPIDDQALRLRWVTDAGRMRGTSIPRSPRPLLRQRARLLLERVAPGAIGVVGRVLKR